MAVAQVRLPKRILEQIDGFVETGVYASRSDVIRDAVRRLALNKQIGSIPNTGDSVEEVRKIRKILSKKPIDLDEINSYGPG